MTSRRDFLTAALGAVALGACSPYLGRFKEEGVMYEIDRNLTQGDLSLNTSKNLKRYPGKPGDPLTGESRLVQLARTETMEESFTFAMPENVWYETGILERGRKVRNVSSVLLQNSGRGNMPKFSQINVYHFHPSYLVAQMVFDYANKATSSPTLERVLNIAYEHSLRPKPPSVGDLKHGITLESLAKKANIKLVQRVADPHGVWEYGFSDAFNQKLFSGTVTKSDFQKLSNQVVKSRSEEFKTKGTSQGYIERLRKNLQQQGFNGDEIEFSYRHVSTFKPSMDEFKREVKKRNMKFNPKKPSKTITFVPA